MTDVADYDEHYLEFSFVGRTNSGLIYLGPDELASKHKIRVNLKIGTKNTRIEVPRELEGWMKTTLGLLTRNVHVHLSRLSSISGTDFVSLLDDAIESILDPTETVIARNTGTTITTNDTSSGAASSLSASQSGTATQSKAFVAYCSNRTELQNVFVSQPPQLLAVQTLVMAVDADGNEIGQRCDQSLDSSFDPCQGQSDSPPVSLREQQVTSSDSPRGQSAMLRVSTQQIDSDDDETAFVAAESFVIDQKHDERIWATLDEGFNAACHSANWAARAERYFGMFGFQSEYREGTRNKVFTGLGGNAVAAVGRRKFPIKLAFTSKRDDIHHSLAPLNLGSCLVTDHSCSRSTRRPG